VVVLKGANTVVASPDGRVFFNTTGNPALATAGSGDVLSGMIVSYLAQGESALNAALTSVWLHGKAADEAETYVSKECWPLPSYGDLLFSVK
jgi:NAD(P)H-hydrate epimerase